MGAWKLTEFESKRFRIVVASLYGVWHVRRKSDDAVSLTETCSEGWEQYQRLKTLWRENRAEFDRRCSNYTFYDESGKELEHENATAI